MVCSQCIIVFYKGVRSPTPFNIFMRDVDQSNGVSVGTSISTSGHYVYFIISSMLILNAIIIMTLLEEDKIKNKKDKAHNFTCT